MKKTLKVTFGTMLAVSMVTPAYAQNFLGETDFLNNLSVFVEGNYTKPSNNGLSVGDLLVTPSAGGLDGWRRQVFLNPENEWDYALGFTYRYCGDSRLILRYDHYDASDDTTNIDIRNIGFAPAPDTAGYAIVQENQHEWLLGLAHSLGFDQGFNLDLMAFLAQDKLDVSLQETQTQFVANQGGGVFAHYHRTTENTMEGFGPGLGAMAQVYPFRCMQNWGFFAGGRTALLYARNSYQQSFYENNSVTPAFYVYDPEDSHSIVTKLDISFGLNYHCGFRHDLGGAMFDIALGMRYMNMFNVLKNGNAAYNPPNGFAGIANFAANTGWPQDWGRFGPFLTFRFGGANA